MRRLTRILAVTGASSILALSVAAPAGATPGPRNEQWWFAAWQIQQKVWPAGKGAGVTVAVIDSGVNTRLPDLRPAVVPGKDFRLADDWSGGSGDGRSDTDPEGHGTAMAALIVSQGAGSGYVGVAPEAKVLPVVASGPSTAEAVRYAADHGAKVINVSQGDPAPFDRCPADVQQAIGYAIQHDSLVVAASGNEGGSTNGSLSPGMCAGVLTVGAIDNRKRAWPKTQRKPYVAVAGPGANVGIVRPNGSFDAGFSGTSQAAALVSGAAALVWSKNPRLSNREVAQRLIATAKDAGPPGKDDQTGAGVVIPGDAMSANVPPSAPNPVFAAYDRWAKTQPKGAQGTARKPGGAASSSPQEEEGGSGTLLIIGVAGAALLVVIVLIVVLFARKGKGRGGPPQGPGAPAPGMYPGGQAPGGPPPGWGGPPGRQGPPPGYR
ncbi:S8 family serine peptidase [Actinomadura xylanilytica]|uniref:S8 family serine peptidase n=1 Tax=Actinomadura xylanilytica TaxID=887459 RepID=UPI00255A9AE7|nr:S8 family serine peptidase [Actinomadura xylanilytica]MDL4772853.1 S8 family serine peptidase [Actinomadura xylanilytica]